MVLFVLQFIMSKPAGHVRVFYNRVFGLGKLVFFEGGGT